MRILAFLLALIIAGPALAQTVTPAAPVPPPQLHFTPAEPVITATPRDYGPNDWCIHSPTTGKRGNFHATRAMDCILLFNPVEDLSFRDFKVDFSRDGVINRFGKGERSPIDGLTFERFDIQANKRGIYLSGDSVKDVTIRDGVVSGIGVATTGIPGGIVLGTSKASGPNVDGVLVERVIAHSFKSTAGGYTNADGFNTERDVHNITFRDTAAYDNTDGCYDLKSTNTRLEGRNYAAWCRHGFRLWGSGVADHLVVDGNTWDDIEIPSTLTDYTIKYLEGQGSKSIRLKFSYAPKYLAILACNKPIQFQGAPKFFKNVTLGQGCKAGDEPVPVPVYEAEQPDLVGLCSFAEPLRDSNKDGVIDLGAANRKICGGAASVKWLGQNRAGQHVYGKAP